MSQSKIFPSIVFCALLVLGVASVPATADAGGAPLAPILLKYGTFTPLADKPQVRPDLMAGPEGRIKLVQVAGPLTSAEYEALERAGASILGYIPEFTYIVDLSETAATVLGKLTQVRWVGPYHPAYKIEAGLLACAAGPVEVNVVLFEKFAAGDERENFVSRVVGLGGEVSSMDEVSRVIQVIISPSRIPDLATCHQVSWIDRWDPPRRCMYYTQLGTGASTVQSFGYDGSGITGEVKDDGIDQSHSDFGNLVGTYGSPPTDSHGTCTFGIVFGDGTGNSNAEGMMPGGSGVFADWGTGRASSMQNLVNTWGGVFQSNSWHQGTTDGDYNSYSQENDQAIISRNAMMFYAAGNSDSGVGATTISTDSAAKNVVCVGAVYHWNTSSLSDDEWHNYGTGSTPSQGPAADGRIKPDLCGFFDSINCTDVSGSGGYASGDYYSNFGGTSAATPIVAGAAGLVYDMYEANHFGNNAAGATPEPATVKALLIANAHQYAMSDATRYQQGWGLPDLEEIHDAGTDQLIVDEGNPLGTGETWTGGVTRLGASIPLKVSLVWDDEPGEASASKALINDLDLRVTAPDDSVYYGNSGLTSTLYSSPGGSFDRTNNVENVFILSPIAGNYTIEVIGYNVAMDNDPASGVNQDFALVATRVGTVIGNTMHAVIACVPDSGTLPFTMQLWPQICNDDWFTRTLKGIINVRLAGGAYYANWRSGSTNVTPANCFTTIIGVNLPNFAALHGDNTFALVGADITAPPYNQPPYSASGDTDSVSCIATGN